MKITLSPPSLTIIEQLENGSGHLFITGKAGTGKSTLLHYFRLHTKIPLVVLAPTGVAAVHIGGETIHSFFHFAPGVTKREARSDAFFTQDRELYRKIEMIIIDEISMVRSDLLDCVDVFLRIVRDDDRAFGGVRMVFFGDLYQLPPVVAGSEREVFRTVYPSEWFFDSTVIRSILESEATNFELFELSTIYRQQDQDFIELLSAIRSRSVTKRHLDTLNTRVDMRSDNAPAITLTSHRDTATEINTTYLAKLPGQEQLYDGTQSGSFPDGHLPTSTQLCLKIGARVMFVANDPDGRYVNGTLGTVKNMKKDGVLVKIDDGKIEEIPPHTWDLTHTVLKAGGEIEKEKLGEFTQLPLMLAWAVTIHKAQGKTFDRVIINLDRGAFAHGQVYVALSRARTLTGISLTHPIRPNDIRVNWRVNHFFVSFALRRSHHLQSREEKYQRIEDAIEMGTTITLTYLKDLSETVTQSVTPIHVGEMTHQGKRFIGLVADLPDRGRLTYNAEKIMFVE